MKSILSILGAVTLSLVVSIVIFPAYPVMAQGTIYVPDDYATIQEAINAAYPGDTVYVRPGTGTYNEYLSIDKSLTLTGEDRDTTIIQAPDMFNMTPTIDIKESNVTISNLTIRSNGVQCVNVDSFNNISLINNNIYNLMLEGVFIKNSGGINLVDNNIQTDGSSNTRSDGVYINGSASANLEGNNIHNSNNGMYLINLDNSNIQNNTISDSERCGIWLENSDGNTITGNTLNENKAGSWLENSHGNTITGNTLNNNRTGIRLNNSGENTITGNTFSNNLWGVFFSGTSQDNQVYNNNFIDTPCLFSGGDYAGTEFYLNPPVGGNYWSDWTPPEHPDNNNDGFVDEHYAVDGYFDEYPWAQQDGWKNSPATVDIKPDTLNLNTKGKWITGYIELEEGYDVADIDVSTVKLNDAVNAESRPNGIGDYDEDGIPDLMVKFDRTSVQEIPLEVGDEVEIVITGELDGTSFEGTDTIRVIDKSND